MNTNIVEIVQNDLGYPAIVKMDPNTNETVGRSSRERLAQSAIPTILAGFFNFTRNDKACNYILAGSGQKNWLDALFGDQKELAVEKIARYSKLSSDDAAANMEDIARKAVIIIQEAPGEKPTPGKLRSYMNGQRHNILVYLPPALQMGDLLNDSAMDDGTNKMEGPISSMMHSIENKLSGGGS
jgi:hypothetical protein